MKSDVYFIEVDTQDKRQRIQALKKLLDRVSPFSEYQKGEFIPIKLTIGDSACVYNLDARLVKFIVAEVKKKAAQPFLFDTCVIYKGERQNAISHLNLAQNKGFVHSKTGAPFIIADGLLGQEGREFKIDSTYINNIKVPSFVGMLDSLIVLSHSTGHMLSGYAGAIKNVAMGMSCRPTKQVQHSSLKPYVIAKDCNGCGCCIEVCPVNAISFKNEKAFIDPNLCIGCGECLCACKFDAIFINWDEDPHIFCKRMVEVAKFILSKFKNKFFLNFAFDIARECDCTSTKEEKMISKNLGILASDDILSIDKATADLANQNNSTSYFVNKKNIYESMFRYANDFGLGNLEYNLVLVK